MLKAPNPRDDAARVASLREMTLLFTPREPDLERVTRTAATVLGTKIALISLVDAERQWFKSRVGMTETETPRDVSICAHAIHAGTTLVVGDTLADERFFDNPMVTAGPRIRFYAGEPIRNTAGYLIGTLCVIDAEPRQFTQTDQRVLHDLARLAETVLENRRLSEAQASLLNSLVEADRKSLIDPVTDIWNARGLHALYEREAARCARDHLPLSAMVLRLQSDGLQPLDATQSARACASVLIDNVRLTDIAGRLDDNRFVVVLPGSSAEALQRVGAKILRQLQDRATLTARLGGAWVDGADDVRPDLASITEAAEHAAGLGKSSLQIMQLQMNNLVSDSQTKARMLRQVASPTDREREVLREIVAGHANKEIAARLAISQRTVETHRATLMKKLGAGSMADLLRIAITTSPTYSLKL